MLRSLCSVAPSGLGPDIFLNLIIYIYRSTAAGLSPRQASTKPHVGHFLSLSVLGAGELQACTMGKLVALGVQEVDFWVAPPPTPNVWNGRLATFSTTRVNGIRAVAAAFGIDSVCWPTGTAADCGLGCCF
jgi:hypothetical protein